MSWMGEVAIMIQDAAEQGVKIELSDFGKDDQGRLTINDVDADLWFAILYTVPDRLEDLNN